MTYLDDDEWMVSSAICAHIGADQISCLSLGLPVQGDAVEIYIMTKEGTKREVMPLKKD